MESLLASAETESQQAMLGLRMKAVETIAGLLDSGVPAMRLQAARLILEATHHSLNGSVESHQIESQQSDHFREMMAVIEGGGGL